MEVGIDIIEVRRIADAYKKYGEVFAKKILLPNEIAYCLSKKYPFPSIAVRFAAKEAFAKAVGKGIGREVTWHALEVTHDESNKPMLKTNKLLSKEIQGKIAGKEITLSLSHTKEYATAVVIIV